MAWRGVALDEGAWSVGRGRGYGKEGAWPEGSALADWSAPGARAGGPRPLLPHPRRASGHVSRRRRPARWTLEAQDGGGAGGGEGEGKSGAAAPARGGTRPGNRAAPGERHTAEGGALNRGGGAPGPPS